jgi:hypothetical protein
MADAYLTFDTKLNTAGFKQGLGAVTGMFTKLATLAGVAFSVGAVVAFGKAAVQAASQAEAKFKGLEFLMKANGRSMSQATSFIKEFTADGLVPMTSAYEAYKNMVSRGYSTEQIEKMLKVMKDAAVYNRQGQFSMGEAIEKATMGLRMENSLLTDSVGIQKNVAKMWQEYAKSIGTTANNLTMLQKRQAEFEGFMAEGGVFAGAAAEYANSYAGRIASITAGFQNLKIAVGNAIIPFINALLPAITQAILWFTKLFNIVGQVVNLLFGTNVGMADAEAAIAGNAEATAAATEQTAANTEKAGKAAKGALASFDKLNVLAQDTSSGGGGGGAGGGGGGTGGGLPTEGQTGGLSAELTALAAKVATIKEMIESAFGTGDFSALATTLSNGIVGALTKAREAIQTFDFKQFGTDIGTGVNDIVASIGSFLTNIDFLEIGKQFGGLLSDSLKGIFDTGSGFLQEVDWQEVGNTIWLGLVSAFDSIKGFVEEFDWSGTVASVFEFLGSAFGAAAALIVTLGTKIWEALKEAWKTTKEKWMEFKDESGGDIWGGILEGIKNAVTNIGTWIKENILDPFMKGFKEAFGISSPSTVMAEQGGYIIDGLKQGIEDAWKKAEDWFSTKVIEPLKKWFTGAWDDIKGFATTAWTGIEETWSTVSNWFETDVLTPIKNKFDSVWTGDDGIKAKITGVWEDVKTAWGEAATWFDTTIWTPISTKAGEIWEAVQKGAGGIATNIGDAIRGAINTVIDWFNGAITDVENAVNGMVDWVNNLTFLGQTVFNFGRVDLPSIPTIPGGGGTSWWELADGAVIPPNAPFMAVMGDQRRGTNLEAPESLIRQIVREESGGGGGQNITITFGGTMGELVRQLKPYIERETSRVGGNMMAKVVRV